MLHVALFPDSGSMSTKLLISKFAVTLQLHIGDNVNYKVNTMMEPKKINTMDANERVARHAKKKPITLASGQTCHDRALVIG